MLRVVIELVPGGRGEARVLSEARIGNMSGGELSKYVVRLGPELDGLSREECHGVVADYPRWSSEVWDLVARSICVALTGNERLPDRPSPLSKAVAVHHAGDIPYVRFSDIPPPARAHFERRMQGSAAPVIDGEGECAYAWDWLDFLGGAR